MNWGIATDKPLADDFDGDGKSDITVFRATADGYLFAAPENLAALSGQMKEFFDRCYYPVLGKIEGRPYGTLIAANDTRADRDQSTDGQVCAGAILSSLAAMATTSFTRTSPRRRRSVSGWSTEWCPPRS